MNTALAVSLSIGSEILHYLVENLSGLVCRTDGVSFLLIASQINVDMDGQEQEGIG